MRWGNPPKIIPPASLIPSATLTFFVILYNSHTKILRAIREASILHTTLLISFLHVFCFCISQNLPLSTFMHCYAYFRVSSCLSAHLSFCLNSAVHSAGIFIHLSQWDSKRSLNHRIVFHCFCYFKESPIPTLLVFCKKCL